MIVVAEEFVGSCILKATHHIFVESLLAIASASHHPTSADQRFGPSLSPENATESIGHIVHPLKKSCRSVEAKMIYSPVLSLNDRNCYGSWSSSQNPCTKSSPKKAVRCFFMSCSKPQETPRKQVTRRSCKTIQFGLDHPHFWHMTYLFDSFIITWSTSMPKDLGLKWPILIGSWPLCPPCMPRPSPPSQFSRLKAADAKPRGQNGNENEISLHLAENGATSWNNKKSSPKF